MKLTKEQLTAQLLDQNKTLKADLSAALSELESEKSLRIALQADYDDLKVEHTGIKINRQVVIDDILSKEVAIRAFFQDYDTKTQDQKNNFYRDAIKALLKIAVSVS